MTAPRPSASPRSVIVTGVAGYIGSHAALALLDRGDRVLGIDNLSRGHPWVVGELARIGGDRFRFEAADLLDGDRLTSAFRASGADLVLHFAALTYVGESVEQPNRYWWNNAAGSISLLSAMRAAGIARIVFSSTCATYGMPEPSQLPIVERTPQHPINPYGHSKLAVERMLLDESAAPTHPPLEVALLRYFNVAGNDPQARLGEDHRPETHLIPICLDTALGRRPHVEIFGDDYPTPDGTCIRDYVHVGDLVAAHLSAMERLAPRRPLIANIGLGRGFSVQEVIESCRRVTGRTIAVRAAPRRAGDPPTLFADASHATTALSWAPRFTTLDEIVATAWAWRRAHPDGYPDAEGGVGSHEA